MSPDILIPGPSPRLVPPPPRRPAPPRPGLSERREHGVERFVRRMRPAAWMTLDWFVIGVTTWVTAACLTRAGHAYAWLARPWLVALTFCLSLTVAGLVFGLYERRALLARSHILVRCTLTLAVGTALAFACVSVLLYAASSRWIGLAVAVSYCAVAVPIRVFAHNVITTRPIRLLCIGDDPSIRKLVDLLGRLQRRQYEIVGHVRAPQGALRMVAGQVTVAARPRLQAAALADFEDACPSLGTLADLAGLLSEYAIDEIVVAAELTGDAAVGRAVALCLEQRCRVTDQPTFVETKLGEVPVENITADWFLRADVQNRGNYEAVRRILDAIVAGAGLILTLPVWPLIVLAVRLDSRGPALFRQVRVGQYGRRFKIFKFRTMRGDAERGGARWATENDARVTRVGRFLRRSRLDELPQLVNILRGDMSLVGPRPERPEFVHGLERVLPHYRLRHLTRPGLTGWAQINYGYGSSVADAHRKLCYDLYYLKHRSLEMDVAILIRTCGTFLVGGR